MNPKVGMALLLVMLLLVLLAPTALAQKPSPPAPATTTHYAVVPSSLSGGNYEFASASWQVVGASAGGQYQLGSPRPDSDLGCCCKGYTPCIRR